MILKICDLFIQRIINKGSYSYLINSVKRPFNVQRRLYKVGPNWPKMNIFFTNSKDYKYIKTYTFILAFKC